MFTLRDYQDIAVKKALEFFTQGSSLGRPIIVAPTAAGKSIYIGHIANELKTGVLVLQPSKELLEQNYGKFKAYGGMASIYSASMGVKEIGDVTFATIGSVKNKQAEFAHVRYIIIDECHLVPPDEESMYMKFLWGLKDIKVIGLTATPIRLKKYRDRFTGETYAKINLLTRERPSFFNDFLHVTQIAELYEKGYLSPVRYIELTWDNGDLLLNTTGAEYTDESIDRAVKEQRIIERIPDIVKQSIEKGRKHRLVFVKNVYDAAFLTSKVPDSACIHSGTKKKDRDQILADFKAGKITTVFNVSVLTVGFDFPALDTIIIARPMFSLTLFMQIVGRGIRPYEGKEDCVVVDMCGNVARFGDISRIVYVEDASGKWVMRDDTKILSGVRME